MKILILGATGRTGKWILEEAILRGMEINMLVRDKKKLNITAESINIFEGTPENYKDMEKAAKDCEAILSTLNISRVSDFPWAKLRTPKDFLEKSMQNIIQVSKILNIKRIIFTSAWGVNETKKDIPVWFRWTIDYSNVRYPYLGHEQQENLLKETDLEWTSVRPVGLTNSIKTKKIKVTLNGSSKPSLTISRKNVAQFILDSLESNLYIRQSPVIST